MKKGEITKKQTVINIASMAIIFLIMLYINFICPYISDDWHFKFIWKDFMPTENEERLRSLADLAESMKNYYMLSGGRVICHMASFIFVNLPKWIFNVINSLMYVLFGYLVYDFVLDGSEKIYRQKFPYLLSVVYMMLFFTLPMFGDNTIWLSGSTNYLWPTTLLLLCEKKLNMLFSKPGLRGMISTLAVLIVSSATNEVTGGMIIVYIVLSMLEQKSKSIKLMLQKIFLMIMTLPGIMLVVLSPGNEHRSQNIEKEKLYNIKNFPEVFSEYYNISIYENIAGIILIILAAFILWNREKGIIENICRHKYFITGAAGIFALCITGFFSYRPAFMGMTFIIIAIIKSAITVYEFLPDKKLSVYIKYGRIAVRAFILLSFIIDIKFISDIAFDIVAYICIEALLLILPKLLKYSRYRKILRQYKSKKIVSAISKAFRSPSAFSKVLCACLSIAVICNAALYTYNTSKMTDYISYVTDLVQNDETDKFETLIYYIYIDNMDAFFPTESSKNHSSDYQLAWMEEYINSENDF